MKDRINKISISPALPPPSSSSSSSSSFPELLSTRINLSQIVAPASSSSSSQKGKEHKENRLADQLIDAMFIRKKVFVDEQGVDVENEIDEDDKRSWSWVLYVHHHHTGQEQDDDIYPVGVIRLVPPPHHPDDEHEHHGQEPYIKLTRVAVLKEYRGMGYARKLVDVALTFARDHPYQLRHSTGIIERENEAKEKEEEKWKGLVLIHAQVPVEKMYARMGFWTDSSLGSWMEEGIEHVGMWKRLSL